MIPRRHYESITNPKGTNELRSARYHTKDYHIEDEFVDMLILLFNSSF